MALIACPECGKSISSSATACPSCGHPIASPAASGGAATSVVTTQQTSKKWKAHQAVGAALVAIGIVLMIAAEPGSGGTGATLAAVGIVWYVVARVGGWWHHA